MNGISFLLEALSFQPGIIPATGDKTRIGIWIALLIVSAVLVLAALLYKHAQDKKREQRRREREKRLERGRQRQKNDNE